MDFFLNTFPSIISKVANEITNFGNYIKTIDIGTKLPYKIIENEDYIRSLFHIKGKLSIKGQINCDIRDTISSNFGIDINHSEPDCKFEITIDKNFQFSIATIFREQLFLGRYKKLKRGISQRSPTNIKYSKNEQTNDECNSCEDSVELFIREILGSDYDVEKTKIIWTGSEDKNSLVMGNGRPFLIKVKMCQNVDTNKIYQKNGMEISFEDFQSDLTNKWKTYRQVVDLLVLIEGVIDDNIDLNQFIAKFVGEVRFKTNNRPITKRIYDSRLMGVKSCNQFEIRLVLDNGIPIKQLVGGQTPIQPSLTHHLNVTCECIYFDIVDVLQSN